MKLSKLIIYFTLLMTCQHVRGMEWVTWPFTWFKQNYFMPRYVAYYKLNEQLIEAVYRRRVEDVEQLLDQGADVNTTVAHSWGKWGCTNCGGYSPIYWAIRNYAGWEEVKKKKAATITLLLNRGANVNQPRFDGKTPLHAGCFYGETKAIEVLLELGADVTLTDTNGVTPLQELNERDDLSVRGLGGVFFYPHAILIPERACSLVALGCCLKQKGVSKDIRRIIFAYAAHTFYDVDMFVEKQVALLRRLCEEKPLSEEVIEQLKEGCNFVLEDMETGEFKKQLKVKYQKLLELKRKMPDETK